MDRRRHDRRSWKPTPTFPLYTSEGVVTEDRRVLPDRRLNNIKVEFLEEPSTVKGQDDT